MMQKYKEILNKIKEFFEKNEDDDYRYVSTYFEELEGDILKQDSETIYKTFLLFQEALDKKVFGNENIFRERIIVYKLLIEFSFIGYDLDPLKFSETRNIIKFIENINIGSLDNVSQDFIILHLDLYNIYNRLLKADKEANKVSEPHYVRIHKRIKETLDIQVKKQKVKEFILKELQERNKDFEYNSRNNKPVVVLFRRIVSVIDLLTESSIEATDDYAKTVLFLMKYLITNEDSIVLFHEPIKKYKESALEIDNKLIIKHKEDIKEVFKEFEKIAEKEGLTGREKEIRLGSYLLDNSI